MLALESIVLHFDHCHLIQKSESSFIFHLPLLVVKISLVGLAINSSP